MRPPQRISRGDKPEKKKAGLRITNSVAPQASADQPLGDGTLAAQAPVRQEADTVVLPVVEEVASAAAAAGVKQTASLGASAAKKGSGQSEKSPAPVRESFMARMQKKRAEEQRLQQEKERAAQAARRQELLAREQVAVADTKFTSLPQRRKEQKRALWRRRWWQLTAGLLRVALVGALTWVLFFSSLLLFTTVRLHANGQLIDQNAAQALVLREKGKSLLRLSTSRLEQELVDSQPAIAQAEVSRVLPHTLEVNLVEARALAAVPQGKTFSLLDDHGVVIAKVEGTDPHLQGLAQVEMDLHSKDAAEIVHNVISALQQLNPEVRQRIHKISAPNVYSLTFTLDNHAQVLWGDKRQPELKAEVLRVLLSRQARVYDVSTPRNPVTR